MTNDQFINITRNEIDRLDNSLHELLQQRFDQVNNIAIQKKSRSKDQIPSYIPSREQKILAMHHELVKSSEYQHYIKSIYQAIFAATRKIQQAYQIAVISNSQHQAHTFAAALLHFGDHHHYIEINCSDLLEQEINHTSLDYAVIESSLYKQNPIRLPMNIIEETQLNCINKHYYILAPIQTEQCHEN